MGTYYVRTDGSDSTGNGSSATPWASLNKAISQISTAGGHTVVFGAGTYSQEMSATKNFTALVTFKPEIAGAEVHLTNDASSNGVLTFGTAAANNMRFENFYIDGGANNPQVVYFAANGTVINNITFYKCTITANGKAGQYIILTYTNGVCAITANFIQCTLTSNQVQSNGVIRATVGTPATQVVTYTFTNCIASNSAACNLTNLEGVTNTVINGGIWTSAGIPIAFGKDNPTGYLTAGCQCKNVFLQSTTSHALLFGGGTDTCTMDSCDITAGNNGVVLKGTNLTVTHNLMRPPDTAQLGHMLLLKGCSNSLVQYNRIYVKDAWYAISNSDGAALTVAGCTVKNNTLVIRGGGSGVMWTTAQDGAGNAIDENIFDAHGQARFGYILATGNCADLAALRAAWSAYGDGSNDAKSSLAKRTLTRLFMNPVSRV